MARGEYALAFGALFLAFTNIGGIQVAGSIVMWFSGYHGARQNRSGEFKRNALSVLLLCALAVVLSIQLREVVSKEVYEASVRRILNTAAKTHQGA